MGAVIKIENLSKQYRLGVIGTGTISHDINRFFAKIRGKEDPFLKVGEVNDRAAKRGSNLVWALKDLTFEVKQGEILGIIGKNGAGKSTLLKLLSKVTGPTTGSIKVKGRIASLLEVGTGFHPELTGRENVFLNGAILGMTKSEIASKLDEIVDFSGCAKYIDTPVKRYSSGMMVRLGFAVAAHLEPEILIVDEVLAVGDAEFQKKSIEKMKNVAGTGRTILFVSHNMVAINNLCDRAIMLDKGGIVADGKTSDIVDLYLHGEKDEVPSFGFVAKTRKRNQYHKELLYVTRVDLFNSIQKKVDILKFHEKVTFKIEVDSVKNIEDVILIIGFMNDDHDKITYSASNDGFNQKNINIQKGVNNFSVEIEQHLIPGSYSMFISIMDKAGYSYDSLSYYGLVSVERFGDNDEKYFWDRPLGLVNPKSKIDKIES